MIKKVLLAAVALVGVGGLIAVVAYKPKAETTTVATTAPTATADTASTAPASTAYKDGSYTGTAFDNQYGTVQVRATVSGGELTGVEFLQMPYEESRSASLSAYAKPILLKEALAAQSASVDIVSGATSTSESFMNSLQSALDQA